MTDEAQSQGGKQEQDASASSGETPSTNGFQTITSQADLDRIVGERLARERQKFADYGDLKKKAEQLDAIEEANKTELQKANDALAAAQSEAAELRLNNVKTKLEASLSNVVPDAASIVDDLDMSKFVDDDGNLSTDAANKLVERFKSLSGPRQPVPDRSQASGSGSGTDGGAGTSPSDIFASIIRQQIGTAF